jgi:protein-tyrosine phosphatase
MKEPAMKPVRVLFVCLGNICRSPTAEGVFRHLVDNEGVAKSVEIDSAGTGAWHAGESPDRRATEAARARGVKLTGKARKAVRADFDRYDYILAMDLDNLDNLRALAPNEAAKDKLRLFRSFDPASPPDAEVPDPYYGGVSGFDDVFDICYAAARGLLAHLCAEHGL